MASGNKSLGQFNLEGIPSAPRGTPQIEVTFDIDSNGILHVSAKDKQTGKENKITIKANTGLSEEEIQRMVKDAEANAAEDHKARELADARNGADAAVHSVRKMLTELGDKVPADEKAKIEAAAKDVEDAVRGTDKAEIEKKAEALMQASQALAQLAGGEGEAGAAPGAGAQADAGKQPDGDVVDAEFTEVKDKK